MRKAFVDAYIKLFAKKNTSVFLTGDLGFMALEPVRKIMKKHFINAGVAEQNMVSVAAGFASAGYIPFVYSIAPFITLKNTEQIRNDLCFTHLPVTLVGNGGGYGYGIMGSTHHVLEDLALFSALPDMTSYIPAFDEDLLPQLKKIKKEKKPAYLRLGLAKKHILTLPPYSAIRHLNRGDAITIFVLGPLIHELLAIKNSDKKLFEQLDIWSISELPFTLPEEALISCKENKRIVVIEEHTQIGGLGSHLNEQLLNGATYPTKYLHLYAKGYPSRRYGNQQFHLNESGLNTTGIIKALKSIFL